MESEKSARKRLGKISKPLKRGLVWLAHQTQRGRFADLADDVYVFASARYFVGEVVEAIVNDQWCDCKIIKVTLLYRSGLVIYVMLGVGFISCAMNCLIQSSYHFLNS